MLTGPVGSPVSIYRRSLVGERVGNYARCHFQDWMPESNLSRQRTYPVASRFSSWAGQASTTATTPLIILPASHRYCNRRPGGDRNSLSTLPWVCDRSAQLEPRRKYSGRAGGQASSRMAVLQSPPALLLHEENSEARATGCNSFRTLNGELVQAFSIARAVSRTLIVVTPFRPMLFTGCRPETGAKHMSSCRSWCANLPRSIITRC